MKLQEPTYSSSGIVALASAAVGATEGTEGFFACDTGVLEAAVGVVRAVVVGRVVEGLVVEEANDVRGAERVVEAAGAERVVEVEAAVRDEVRGRFAVVEVVDGVIVDLRSDAAVLPGDDLVAAVEVNVVLRAAGFLFSSPEVMEDRSGSASEVADLEVKPARRAAVPGAGRVGGLFKLEPAVLERIVDVPSGLDAVVEALGVVVVVAGRLAAEVAEEVVGGRRGGT